MFPLNNDKRCIQWELRLGRFRGLKITKFSPSPNHGGRQLIPLPKIKNINKNLISTPDNSFNYIIMYSYNRENLNL